ncbi:DNA cytosine methyltransferase [Allokutzneria multivorans]|uniref:DNA (cytosine-5-)-methyltransferase n=1 Tax=Allokutzneria multivorans TaxID=1142134 RepID=A0ABP7SBT5_9PSEU
MLEIIDHFSGAGGSSQGAEAVDGVRCAHAINHCDLALRTHAANFPHVDHSITDLSTINPRYFRRTDLAWFSPECTNHSQAKGVKRARQPDLFGEVLPDEMAERSRATMWDVVRFTSVHRYEAVVVENVVDVLFWTDFPAWLTAMVNEGYDYTIVFVNSMHVPSAKTPRAPQSRDRVYFAFTKKGNQAPDFELRPEAYCPNCDEVVRAMQAFKPQKKTWPWARWGRYRAQYIYRCPQASCRNSQVEPFTAPAMEAIDWSNLGQRIGDRKKPLEPATLRRITTGLKQHGKAMLVPAGGGWNEDCMPVDLPMRTRTTTETEGLTVPPAGLLVPCEGRDGKYAQPVSMPMRTQTTRAETALLQPPGAALIAPYYGNETTAFPASAPLRTVTGTDRFGIAFVASLRGGGCKTKVRSVQEPLATVTAEGNHHMLVRHDELRGPLQRGRDGGAASAGNAAWWAGVLNFARFSVAASGATVDHDNLPPALADSTFRMLDPDEIRAAMAFNKGYILLGNRRQQVKQLGNAVTPPAAEWLIARIAESLGYPQPEPHALPSSTLTSA